MTGPDFPRPRARLLASGVVGNLLEWYDFALYGTLAPVTARLFFPATDPLASLIDTYAVFALGFLVRPLGGLMFGLVGDRVGRQRSMVLSVAMMAIPTFCMGLLPTYADAGVAAPLALALLRVVQGLSVGGEFSGSIILLVESAPPHRRGLYGSIANFGAMIGGVLGGGIGWLITAWLPEAELQAWGWRLPFLTGIAVGAFGLWLRRSVPESPTYARLASAGQLPRRPLRQALIGDGRRMVLAAGLNWAVSAGYYLAFVWLTSDLTMVAGLPYHVALGIGTLGPLPAVFVSLYGPASRCTALALSYNLALALFGGTAPLISTLLLRLSGWTPAPGLYLAATALLCLALVRHHLPKTEPVSL